MIQVAVARSLTCEFGTAAMADCLRRRARFLALVTEEVGEG